MKRLLLYFLVGATTALCACAAGRTTLERQGQAEAALARGDTSRAIRIFETVADESDVDAASIVQLGRLQRSRRTIAGRLRSQEVLERGRQLFPDNTQILYELGLTYAAQTFYHDAATCFRAVVERDSSFCDAHHQLGLHWFRRWRHIVMYWDYLAEARRHFKRTVECDPQNTDAYCKLVFAAWALDQELNAQKWSRELLARHPDVPEAILLAGAMAYEKFRFDECDADFERALSLMDDDERRAHEDISILIPNGASLDEYEAATTEKRREIERAFWIERDPDPTTEINERWLEHLYRMTLADWYLSHDRLGYRGWDTERGRILVKYGWPKQIRTTLEGRSLDGRKEIWQYADRRKFIRIEFLDQFLNGNYIIPIAMTSDASILYHDPPLSTYESEAVMIPGRMELLSFRNDDTSSAVYVTARVDLDSLDTYVDLQTTSEFKQRTAFFNNVWERQAQFERIVDPQELLDRRRRLQHWYQHVARFDMPFDRLEVAYCLEDSHATAKTLMMSETDTQRYLTDSLIVSDILLHMDAPMEEPSAMFERGEHSFYPNPTHEYAPGVRLRLYAEIYNLDVRRRFSEYDITYSIYTAPERRGRVARILGGMKRMMGFSDAPDPVISQTLHRTSPGHRSEENLAIDIDALEPGHYILNVSVLDQTSLQTASRETPFWKRAPSPY